MMSTYDDQKWEDAYWASVDREIAEEHYRQLDKQDMEAAEDSGFDGPLCPHCGSAYTVLIDTICNDPVIWHCECASCEQGFEHINA